MSDKQATDSSPQFRRTLFRVMTVQVITLVLLYLVQRHFSV